MPASTIERIAEGAKTLSLEASLQLWSERRSADRRDEFDHKIDALSRELTNATPGEIDQAILVALESLARAFEADRVAFYESPATGKTLGASGIRLTAVTAADDETATRFEARRSFGSDAGFQAGYGHAPSIDVVRFPNAGTGLIAGYAERGYGTTTERGSALSSGWRPVQTTLSIPCSTGDTLYGFFEVQAGLAVSRWDESLVARAEFLGRFFAMSLERLALVARVEEATCRKGHEARLETLGRVASAVAHDFNNVLTAILGYADLLEIELEEGGGQSELVEIRGAATRAAGLVEQVLSFGRTRRTGIEAIDLAETVESFGGMLRQVVGADVSVNFDWAPNSEGVRVELDPGRLGPVIMNLASNARGALAQNPAGGEFRLSTRRVRIPGDEEAPISSQGATVSVGQLDPGDYLCLTAADDGCGIEAAVLERIFEPFFTTKRPKEGTGLGLASMAEFVEKAGGAIRVETAPGEGTKFHLYFPVVAGSPAL